VTLPAPSPAFSRPQKLLRIALAFARGAWIVARRFPALDATQKHQEVQRWAQQVLAILEIPVQTNMPAPSGFTGLVVCNHLSWLDVLVLQSLMPVVFVAKSEVRRWPVVGYLAQAAATIFVDRSSARSAHAMVKDSAAAIAQGHAVVAFPEGTSSDGSRLGAFHANIFECAVQAACPVQLLTLQYRDPTGASATAAHFTGDMTLLASLTSVTGTSCIRAQVHLGECLSAAGQSRKTLAQQAHAKMNAHFLTPAQDAR
jgi:1-acyl-sn-glycerol-3-phosphate acyltransferase